MGCTSDGCGKPKKRFLRRCLGARERVPAVLVEGGQCTSYEDSSCLARNEGVGGVQTSLGGPRIGRRANFCCSLLYISLYRKLLYKAENRCIRRYTRTRIASQPSRAIQLYSAIQRYTTLYSIQLYSAIHYTTSATPLWASVSITEALVGGRRGREPPSDT